MRKLSLAVGLLSLMVALPVQAGIIVYSNDFEPPGGPGPEWSNTSTSITPGGCLHCTTFLGVPFANDTVSLTLGGLPAHTALTLSFSLFVLASWDGNDTLYGPDHWLLGVAGGPILLDATFSNTEIDNHRQSYPDNHPSDHPGRTGAAENNTLGYAIPYGDSVYSLTYTIPHSAGSVQFDFMASNLQGWWDEGWGLDNVSVEALGTTGVIPEPAAIALAGAGLALLALLRRRRG